MKRIRRWLLNGLALLATVRRPSEIPDPPSFNARAVHQLRNRLGLSLGLFANLLGVSRKLVEAWEAGMRRPSPMACRLSDAIARHPSAYVRRRRRVA